MNNLMELKAAVLADGVLDAREVDQLRAAVFADGEIDRDEATLLFEINTAVSGKDNHASWTTLFVEAISAHVLNDAETPGEVSDEEASYLVQQIGADGNVDANERALLLNLRANMQAPVPAALQALLNLV